MKPMTPMNLAAIATLLGASLLMSTPIAQADQAKWWQPKESKRAEPRRGDRVERRAEPRRGDRVERRVEDRRADRVERRVGARQDGSLHRGFNRQYRQWRGNRIYRDVIVIRDNQRGPRYRAWRSYAEPEFIYRRRIVRLRPVRYYVSASVVIGGVHVNARVHDHDDYYYGCNFCDARYESYGSYRAHVYECDARPRGYQIVTNDWNDRELRDSDWWDDRNWERDQEYDRNRDQGDDEDYDRDRDSGY